MSIKKRDADFCLRVRGDRLAAFLCTDDGKVIIFKDPNGYDETEFVVAFVNNQVVIGQKAKEYLKTHPESVIYDFFDMFGLTTDEISINDEWKFKVFESDGQDIEIGFLDGTQRCRMSVTNTMALFLHGIKKNVEDTLGYKTKTVQIHVQLGITKAQKENFFKAARMIGLQTL
jgi:molecular chaperone DnaK